MKRKYIIGLGIILVFAVFAVWSFRSAMTPYVSFAEARERSGQVQVLGYLVNDEVGYDVSGNLSFELEDEKGERARVVYDGSAPDNLDHAENIVVVGEHQGDRFEASRLLVKCPSKYEKEQD